MKNKNIVALLLCLLLASCGEDRRMEYIEITAPDRWIESVVRENYYWYEDMPAANSLNYFSPATTFFNKLLVSQDKSSYLEDPTDTESKKSYGIEFYAQIYNDTAYALKVLRVDTDSPAETAGLERGDWIIKRNNEYIIKSRIDSLHKGTAITVTRGTYEQGQNENGDPIDTFKDKDILKMSAARITSSNPLLFWDIFNTGSKNVGYLAYNSFTPGRNENDETYDNMLRSISNDFSGKIDEMILDLRYNTGGELKSAHLLGSILAPQEALENPMCHLVFSDKQASRDTTWLFNKDVLGTGSNLNLKKLYVIVGANTASTSEVMINSLKAYIQDVTLIGQTTKGIFAGTHAYTSATNEYPYILHPVDCMIHSAKDPQPKTGYTPTHSINELGYVDTYPFGSDKELLLYATLYLIETGDIPEELKPTPETSRVSGYCTLDNVQIRATFIR